VLYVWIAWALAAPEIVVLGIAQDAGHPQAGCSKTCCTAAWGDPARRHHVASLGIRDGDQTWIIDATPSFPDQLHALSPDGSLDGILLTHGHMGHYTGLLHLGREVMGAPDIPVYAMPRLAGMLSGSEPWALLTRLDHMDVRVASADVAIPLNERITATPFVVPHRDELSETVGWIVKGPKRSIAWLPDIDKWEKWETPVEDLIASVDVAFLDATFYANGEISRDMALVPHPFVVETLERLKERPELLAKVRLVHLNHTNPLLDPASEASKTMKAAGLAVAAQGEVHPL
jgi:pyrroloquinoline quinone biosynthesis protein B